MKFFPTFVTVLHLTLECAMKKQLLKMLLIIGAGIASYFIIIHPLNWGISEELGSGFIITSDKSLLYRDGNTEYFVLPFGVTKYTYNTKWIVAYTEGYSITRNLQEKKNSSSLTNYWIIDKEMPIHHNKQDSVVLYINGIAYPIITNGLIGPMDSLSFIDSVRKFDIPLRIN